MNTIGAKPSALSDLQRMNQQVHCYSTASTSSNRAHAGILHAIVQYASRVPYRSVCMLVLCQQFTQKAKKLIRQCATISDKPVVVFLDLSLAIYTLWVEKKLLLSLLSIESEVGGGDQQTPELLIEAFQLNPHNSYNQQWRSQDLAEGGAKPIRACAKF
jgi:hypothetical protein